MEEVILIFPSNNEDPYEFKGGTLEKAKAILGGPYNILMTTHLNVPFTLFFMTLGEEINPLEFEVAKRILKAIHRWALEK